MKLPPGYVPGVGVTRPTAYGGFGERLLKQYGWKDGEGLGAEGGGIKTALKVLKKDDTIGVGARQIIRENATTDWWQQSFDSAALNLRQDDSEASDSSDDSDDEADTPSARRNRDGTLASGTRAELRLARELAKDPWGRFGGRGGKLARIREQEAAMAAAMAAAAGGGVSTSEVASQPAEPPKKKRKLAEKAQTLPEEPAAQDVSEPLPKAKTARKGKRASKTHAESSSAALDPSKPAEPCDAAEPSGAQKRAKKSKKKAGSASEPAARGPPQEGGREEGVGVGVVPAAATPRPADWWGASQFVSSGCLGGLKEEPKQRERASFTEDTQEALYNSTQAGKTAGKKGLGRGQGKAAGHEWRGSKVVFEDNADVVVPSATHAAPEEETPTAAGNEAGEAPVAKISSKQLRKSARQILKVSGKKLKISKLAKQLNGMKPASSSTAEFQTLVIKKVAGCPKMAVEGKYVKLVA